MPRGEKGPAQFGRTNEERKFFDEPKLRSAQEAAENVGDRQDEANQIIGETPTERKFFGERNPNQVQKEKTTWLKRFIKRDYNNKMETRDQEWQMLKDAINDATDKKTPEAYQKAYDLLAYGADAIEEGAARDEEFMTMIEKMGLSTKNPAEIVAQLKDILEQKIENVLPAEERKDKAA
ncbi:MAG: hypothetical protein WC480_04970 [Patescibacteria group bacterium]